MSWRSLRGHKLRSTLTTVGVIIGVAAVITLVTLGASLQSDIVGQVSGGQVTTMYVWAGPSSQGGRPGFGSQPVFTERDVRRMENVSGVQSVVPQTTIPTTALTYEGDTVGQSSVVATTPASFAGQGFRAGGPFTQGNREVVLNPLAARLFTPNATVGGTVTLELTTGQSVNATVVGILNESTAAGPFGGFGTSPQVYVPTDPFVNPSVKSPTTGERQRVYPLVTVVAADPQQVDAVQGQVQGYLNGSSDANQLKPNGYSFQVTTNQQLLDQLRNILDTLTGFITGIALISLFVGSIGIANIMLVSVTERTKEIGIMKAVGAQRRDVLELFLAEAVMLGVLGSVLGTVVGVVGAYVATQLIGLPLVFAFEWFGIAVVVGIVVGIVAGVYPAWNAARIDPMDALRFE